MKLLRRTLLQFVGAVVGVPTFSRLARAQIYPARPIKMIVPFPPSGPVDVSARLMAERMRSSLGQPIIIENISGANGTIGVGQAVRAQPDGYTIVLGATNTHVLNGALYSLPYDVLNDFAPISLLARVSYFLFVSKAVPAKDLNEFITWLKANPNSVSAGISSASAQLNTALFQKETGTHFALVPYRGLALAVQDLMAGRIELLFGTPDQLPLVWAGNIKAFAVTSDTRLVRASDIPTFSEMGLPALSFSAWGGLFAPKGTPRDIVGKLHAAVVDALADAAMRSRLVDLGMEVVPREQQTPEALRAWQKADAERWWPIIKELGLKAD